MPRLTPLTSIFLMIFSSRTLYFRYTKKLVGKTLSNGVTVLGVTVLGVTVLGVTVLGVTVLGVTVLGVTVLGVTVLGVTVLGDSLELAISNVYYAAEKISWASKYCRTDIGKKGLNFL